MPRYTIGNTNTSKIDDRLDKIASYIQKVAGPDPSLSNIQYDVEIEPNIILNNKAFQSHMEDVRKKIADIIQKIAKKNDDEVTASSWVSLGKIDTQQFIRFYSEYKAYAQKFGEKVDDIWTEIFNNIKERRQDPSFEHIFSEKTFGAIEYTGKDAAEREINKIIESLKLERKRVAIESSKLHDEIEKDVSQIKDDLSFGDDDSDGITDTWNQYVKKTLEARDTTDNTTGDIKEDYTELIKVLQSVNSSILTIRNTLQTVDSDTGFGNIISQLSILTDRMNEVAERVANIKLNVSFGQENQNRVNEMEQYLQSQLLRYQKAYDKILGAAGSSDNFFASLIQAPSLRNSTTIGELESLYSRSGLANAGDIRQQIAAYQRVFEYFKEAITANQDATDEFWRTVSDSIKRLPSSSMSNINKRISEIWKEDTKESAVESFEKALQNASDNTLSNQFDMTEVVEQLKEIQEIIAGITHSSAVKEHIDEIVQKLNSIQQSTRDLIKNLLEAIQKIDVNLKSGNTIDSVLDVDARNSSTIENLQNVDGNLHNIEESASSAKAKLEDVIYHAGILSKLNKAETNGQFYGSNRGTGYFGTGHYFVDAAHKGEISNGSYKNLPYSSVDISHYNNLFRAETDAIADALHEFLKHLTQYTQGIDRYSSDELFDDFKQIFGDSALTVDVFKQRLEDLTTYMQSSSHRDRGDSVSTQFMKSLGYGGVDTRGTKFADTRYGIVIYDLQEQSVLEANITDELKKQGDMRERLRDINQSVFNEEEDARIQRILDKQRQEKEIDATYRRIFDTTNIDEATSKLETAQNRISEIDDLISNLEVSLANIERETKSELKDFADMGLSIPEGEYERLLKENSTSYQTRIEELVAEREALSSQIPVLQEKFDAENKLSQLAYDYASDIVKGSRAENEAVSELQNKLNDARSSEVVQESIGNEQQKLEDFYLTIQKVIEAIQLKNNEFDNEKLVVNAALEQEISKLSEFESELRQVADASNVKLVFDTDGISVKVTPDTTNFLKNIQDAISDKSVNVKVQGYRRTKQDSLNNVTPESLKAEREKTVLDYYAEQKKILDKIYNLKEKNLKLDLSTEKGKAQEIINQREINRLEEDFNNLNLNAWLAGEAGLKTQKQAVSNYRDELQQALDDQMALSKASAIDSLDNMADSLAKLKESGKYTVRITHDIQDMLDEIKNLKKVDISFDEFISQANKLESSFDDLKSKLNFDESKKATELALSKLGDKIEKFGNKNSAITGQLRTELASIRRAFADLKDADQDALKKLQIRLNNLEAEANRLGQTGLSSFDQFKKRLQSLNTTFFAKFFSTADLIRYGRQAFETVHSLDTALVDLKKTTTMSGSELEQFYYDSNDVAKSLGVTTEEIINQAAAWSRLNYLGPLCGNA